MFKLEYSSWQYPLPKERLSQWLCFVRHSSIGEGVMPLYEYEPDSGQCDQCGGRFEVLQSLHEPPLTHCPECGKPCHRVFSSFAAIKSEKATLSPKNLQQHGFTQYKRAGDGYYEKTCGKGPRVIKRD